jgi:hypothetical protein
VSGAESHRPPPQPAAGSPDAEPASADVRARLEQKADALPQRPGVYLFKDRRGKVIYVGKAKSLRDRVRSYLSAADSRYTVAFLMERAADIETLVTASETEALILENNLIKQYKPRYNIRLKDDKSYVSVKVTTKDAWPRLFVTRKIVRDGNTYLGPYGSARRSTPSARCSRCARAPTPCSATAAGRASSTKSTVAWRPASTTSIRSSTEDNSTVRYSCWKGRRTRW